MDGKVITNVRLGLFVMAGLAFIILTLYMIGKNRNVFGSSFTIRVKFENVNGLVRGNNVRFRGIDVGTVKDILVEDDTSIIVDLTVRKKFMEYIKQNSVASIGTDGLMGNKLININSPPNPAPSVRDHSTLTTIPPVETDQMLRTLNTTNRTIGVITMNIEQITNKLNRNNSLWSLLGDTTLARDLKLTVRDIRRAGKNLASITSHAEELVSDLNNEKGMAGALISDSTFKLRLSRSLESVELASHDLSVVVANVNKMIDDVYHGDGTSAQLISDTLTRQKLLKVISNAEEGTARFSENMEALKHNFLLRRYFAKEKRRKELEAAKGNK